MGRMDGKVALVTGAARGQGRAHAVRLAEEGADIIAIDICDQIPSVPYAMATPDDLKQTVALVEDLDRRIVARQVDCRDQGQLDALVREGIAELGHIDTLVVNHGIGDAGVCWELSEEQWQDMIDTNLTAVWKSIKAVVPHMIERGQGGCIIITSSVAGLKSFPGLAHYSAAKFGVVGLAGSLVNELSPHMIRVNTIHPTSVATDMLMSQMFLDLVGGGTVEGMEATMKTMNALPIGWVEPVDIANAVLWLASDEARYVTGLKLAVDAGFMTRVG